MSYVTKNSSSQMIGFILGKEEGSSSTGIQDLNLIMTAELLSPLHDLWTVPYMTAIHRLQLLGEEI
jgi:hypothetical protein